MHGTLSLAATDGSGLKSDFHAVVTRWAADVEEGHTTIEMDLEGPPGMSGRCTVHLGPPMGFAGWLAGPGRRPVGLAGSGNGPLKEST